MENSKMERLQEDLLENWIFHGDITRVANACNVKPQTVHSVLRGKKKSSRVMTEILRQAAQNKRKREEALLLD
jgi:hypothetical protein